MRLRRRNLEQRIRRVRLRASTQRPPARIDVPAQAKFSGPANASRAVPPQSEPDARRASRRLALTTEISVRKAGGFNFQLPALEVSTDGCRVELVEMVDVGERVIVRLPALEPLGAVVAWVEGNQAGIRFQRPLHPAVFDQLIDRFAACAA